VCLFAEQVDKSGSSALHKACAKGHSAAAEVLLAVDPDPDPRDNCRYTPLHKVRERQERKEQTGCVYEASRKSTPERTSFGLPVCHHTAPSSSLGTLV